MKLCFVVHRYAPYPGGSEYYVQQMAEEASNRGHDVTVIAGEHKGNLNGVRVTNESCYLQDQDLVIVHGCDVSIQDFVLSNIHLINSKVLYLIIKPSNSITAIKGLKDSTYLGYSTPEDYDHILNYGYGAKARKVTHGISPVDCIGKAGIFKKKYGIPDDTKMFLSCGGYWYNKRMIELAGIFNKVQPKDSILVTTGYDNRSNLMPERTDHVLPLMIDDPMEVKNAIADAHAYIMHSSSEGFGLVILESMINKTPWISNNIAAAKMLSDFGTVYDTDEELINILSNFTVDKNKVDEAYKHVISNYLISNTVDNIESIVSTHNLLSYK